LQRCGAYSARDLRAFIKPKNGVNVLAKFTRKADLPHREPQTPPVMLVRVQACRKGALYGAGGGAESNSATGGIDLQHGEMLCIGKLPNLIGGVGQSCYALRGQFGSIAADQQCGKVGSAAGTTSRFGSVAQMDRDEQRRFVRRSRNRTDLLDRPQAVGQCAAPAGHVCLVPLHRGSDRSSMRTRGSARPYGMLPHPPIAGPVG
jgi:hypothetical protein